VGDLKLEVEGKGEGKFYAAVSGAVKRILSAMTRTAWFSAVNDANSSIHSSELSGAGGGWRERSQSCELCRKKS
jgi:hypothetical protein